MNKTTTRICENDPKHACPADTDRHFSNRAHWARMDSLQDFYDFSPVSYLTIDPEGRLLDVNIATSVILGSPRSDLIGRPLYSKIFREDRDKLYRHLRAIFRDQTHKTCELRLTTVDAGITHAVLNSIFAEDRTGRGLCRTVLVDITERKRLEAALVKAHDEMESRVRRRTAELTRKAEVLENLNRQLERMHAKISQKHAQRMYLSKRLVELLENERREISMTLHDKVGQDLVTLKMELELLEMRLPEKSEIIEPLRTTQRKTIEIITYLRDFSQALRSDVLDNLGLDAGIRTLIQNMNSYAPGMDIRYVCPKAPEFLNQEKKTALYRIVQEALTNCIKHAHTDVIYVHLKDHEKRISVSIRDRGKGFQYSEVAEYAENGRGFQGISIMRERALQQDGFFWVQSEPGKGTRVTASIPL